MKIVIKKRQQVGELWQTVFEYKFDEQLIGKEICVDNIAEGPRELKGFLGTSKIINNDTVRFGFKVLKKIDCSIFFYIIFLVLLFLYYSLLVNF